MKRFFKIGRYRYIKFAYSLIDIIGMMAMMYLAFMARAGSFSFEITVQNLFFNPINPYRELLLVWILASVFINNSYGLYETRRESLEPMEIWTVLRAVGTSALLIIVVLYGVDMEGLPRTVLALVFFFSSLYFTVWRLCKRVFVNFIVKRGYNNFKVLIIGAGRVGRNLASEIHHRPELGLQIVGFLDDNKKNVHADIQSQVIGKLSDVKDVLHQEFIDKVFLTIHLNGDLMLKVLQAAKERGVSVRVIPHGYELMTGEIKKLNIGIIPVLEYCQDHVCRKQAGKRLFDFVMTFLIIVFTLPLMILIAIVIKWDSPGPIFFTSQRYGRNGKKFKMIKFRSMSANASKTFEQLKKKNEVDGPIFKMRQDPRVTSLGRVLRKYSLDELPQLFNVLKGDMSLVGPRPLPIEQVEKEDIRQLRRLEVRPGITGLWQIRGRSDLPFRRLLRWDVWYINNWSFWLDLTILYLTFPAVIKAKGAY